jgi:hypothetical protein
MQIPGHRQSKKAFAAFSKPIVALPAKFPKYDLSIMAAVHILKCGPTS